jgi:dynein heavy chain, axonemal
VEASNQVLGKTVLYLPSQLSEITDVAAAAKDKDLVQHLESIVIHWTRQIKDVVSTASYYYQIGSKSIGNSSAKL